MGAAAVIGGGLSIAGSIMGRNASRAAGRAQQRALNYQAELNEAEAKRVEEQTVEQLRRFRVQVGQAEGANRASLGASGITTEGSAMDVLEMNARNAKLDELNIEYKGERRAEALREEAKLNRMGGQAARSAAYAEGDAQLVGGIGRTILKFRGD